MPARKIPLVWKTQKESDQTYFKFSHTSQRVVQVGCDCPSASPPPPVCTPPDPADSVTLSNLTATGGDISFVYGGTETVFSAEIYTSATLPVNTGGSPVQIFVGSLPPSGQTYAFPTILNNYYVVGLRVRKDCGGGVYEYSSYVYSNPVQYVLPQFTFLAFGVSSTPTKYYISGSYDGITWSQTTISGDSFTNFANDGAYDSATQRWIAVGAVTGQCASISDDNGLTWSSTGLTNFFTTSATGIAIGNNRWVATGYFNPGLLLTSTDGLTWSTTTGDTFGLGGSLGRGVAFHNGTWIAVGKTLTSGYSILRSTNGTSWTGVLPGPFEGYKVAYGNGVWIVVGEGTNTIYRSTDDGLTWNPVAGYGFSARGRSIAYDGSGRWVAVGVDTQYSIITSTDDGVTWSDVGSINQHFSSDGGYDVLFKNSIWVACGASGFSATLILKSSDGINWSNCSGDTFGTAAVFGLATV